MKPGNRTNHHKGRRHRGICPSCGNNVTVRINGSLSHHFRPDGHQCKAALAVPETHIATSDYISLMEDARVGQVCRARLQAMLDSHDFDPCGQGCGEMGVCHADLRPEFLALCDQIGLRKVP